MHLIISTREEMVTGSKLSTVRGGSLFWFKEIIAVLSRRDLGHLKHDSFKKILPVSIFGLFNIPK
jgi:hypothetical protein